MAALLEADPEGAVPTLPGPAQGYHGVVIATVLLGVVELVPASCVRLTQQQVGARGGHWWRKTVGGWVSASSPLEAAPHPHAPVSLSLLGSPGAPWECRRVRRQRVAEIAVGEDRGEVWLTGPPLGAQPEPGEGLRGSLS